MVRPTRTGARHATTMIALAAIAATIAAASGASAQATPPIGQYQAQSAYGTNFPCDPSLWGPDVDIIVSNAKVIRGTTGDDVICGGKAANRIIATQGGNDIVFGGGGNDKITLGPGTAVGEAIGIPQAWGGAGNDIIRQKSSKPRDHVWLIGGTGNDTITAGSGNQTLIGGPGNDVLRSTKGLQDFISGGPGNDELFVTKGDAVEGGDGTDSVEVTVNGPARSNALCWRIETVVGNCFERPGAYPSDWEFGGAPDGLL